MALSILDGNQTATTLSTVVSAGAHIPAHTVVSLGSQAITDMRSAVSGSVVSISNLPATQTIAGTVTAVAQGINVQNGLPTNLPIASAGDGFIEDGARLGVQLLGQDGLEVGQGSSCVLPINGTVTANLSSVPTHGVTIANTSVTVNGTVTVGNSVTIGSLPNINGTVMLFGSSGDRIDDGGVLPVYGPNGGNVPISGTVTANVPLVSNLPTSQQQGIPVVLITDEGKSVFDVNQAIRSTLVTALPAGTNRIGTVTVSALPSGALTTRFGSVTTANLAQLSSAVTNTSRKYLLCQNLDSSTTVTIGIGFTPTTTQGIQLAAGGGIIMDSFVSTGAVWWISSTTGSNFTILEG